MKKLSCFLFYKKIAGTRNGAECLELLKLGKTKAFHARFFFSSLENSFRMSLNVLLKRDKLLSIVFIIV